jgi:hypothetical protein
MVSIGLSGHLPIMIFKTCEMSGFHSSFAEDSVFFLSITNKMQSYTIFTTTVNALHVSGGFSAHHQELKNCTHSI